MTAYYNEHDRFAAAWLRELMREGVIAPGDVDERDIREVRATDLDGYAQCHFFAGIGVWSYALRQAGWPDDKRVWTGSCPCQPFSVSGKRAGASDGRHLWPVWFPLIRQCRPVTVFGEQVASDDGLAWLDLVHADLENEDYTVGAVDSCAAGFGAFHIRQRLYFVAISDRTRQQAGRLSVRSRESREAAFIESGTGSVADAEHTERWPISGHREDGRDGQNSGRPEAYGFAGTRGEIRSVGDTENIGHERSGSARRRRDGLADDGELGDAAGRGFGVRGSASRNARRPALAGGSVELGDPIGAGLERYAGNGDDGNQPGRLDAQPRGSVAASGIWRDPVWLPCRDGKARPVEPCTEPLADGIAASVRFVCLTCGNETEKVDENLSDVRCEPQGHGQLVSKEVLQPSMLRKEQRGNTNHSDSRELQGSISIPRGQMREMRKDEETMPDSPSSQGRQSTEQRTVEHSNLVCSLPSSRAPQAASNLLLRDLWTNLCGEVSSKNGESLFCSVCQEARNHIRKEAMVEIAYDALGLVRDADRAYLSPLIVKGKNRVGRLRGYGNALCSPQAIAFIKAAMTP